MFNLEVASTASRVGRTRSRSHFSVCVGFDPWRTVFFPIIFLVKTMASPTNTHETPDEIEANASPIIESNRTARLAAAGIGAVVLVVVMYLCRTIAEPGPAKPEAGLVWLGVAVLFIAHLAAIAEGRRHMPKPVVVVAALTALMLETWAGLHAAQALFGRQIELQSVLDAFAVLAIGASALLTLKSMRASVTALGSGRLEGAPADVDPLTGLLTRDGFITWHSKLRRGATASVIMMDLNGLKRTNRKDGFGNGDERVRSTANAIRESLPGGATAARWNDDEFMILLPGRHERAAFELAHRLQENLPGPHPSLPAFSFGVAPTTGGRPIERAVAIAESRMYDDKEKQRRAALANANADVSRVFTPEDFAARLGMLTERHEIVSIGLGMARDLLGFDLFEYFEREDDGTYVMTRIEGALESGMESLAGRAEFHAGNGLIGKAIETGKTTFSSDYSDDLAAREEANVRGIKSMVVAPVVDQGEVVALVALLSYRTWRSITPKVRRTLEAVSLRVRQAFERDHAIENARASLENSLLALGVGMESRDLETLGHTERVVRYAEEIGRALGLRGQKLDSLRQGAYLHDLGKMSIPDAVLLKPGKLTEEEFNVMKTHAALGWELAKKIPGLDTDALAVIRHHHERWDGKGYPDGLAARAIPLPARIFALCDVYDALTSERPYKKAWTEEEAIAEMRRLKGAQFDPEIVEVFAERVLDKVSIKVNETIIDFGGATVVGRGPQRR